MNLRADSPSDSQTIATLHADSWNSAVRGALNDDYVTGSIAADREALRTSRLTNPSLSQHVVVAHDDDDVLPFFCIVLLLIPLIFLAACTRQAEHGLEQKSSAGSAAAPSTPPINSKGMKKKQDELLGAIFQNAYRPESGDALAEIQDAGEAAKYLMTFVSSIERVDGRAAVITNAMPADEEGQAQFGHSSPGLLNVYFLQRSDGIWKVLERRENIGAMGSNGNIGNVEWVTLAPEKQGFVVSSGGTWQGYTATMAEVFDLADGVVSLGSFRNHSSNSGACTEQADECWEVTGTLRFVDSSQPNAYRDILVDFAGKKYTITEGKGGTATEHLKASIKETARYRFDGKQYKLISGTNPVPEI
ncbi:hypothetical protein [Noviherbaspirillum malthae]|jgi:hypothetical protein|uniref:hypothetical protein n=1 Tax=Noviherbaspirillum malthae TaxID=1260987 RepID=UPI00188F82AD|nr:hypothetical protein [Noviherbaspirillum malthae]